MIKRTSQTQNRLPLHHRLKPIREGLAWRPKMPHPGLLGQRKSATLPLKPERPSYIIAQRMGLLARFNADPPSKSP